jgi:hypothetical protein
MANATRPVVEIYSGGAPKRKRSSSEGSPDIVQATPDTKRRKGNGAMENRTPAPELVSTPATTDGMSAKLEAVPDLDRIREGVESQLSLEILMKHNELRLINQELAKCQAALEQLRRCHLIPFPTSQGTPESMQHVSNGTGPAVTQGSNVPQWAPAYGVTDGPYTRHYAKWLIPDPAFDGVQVGWQRGSDISRAGKTVPEGRSTRHSFVEGSTAGSKSRSQRGSSGQKLQALSSGYPQAKEKAGPCILKRSDGQMVKLVCLDCNRDNFSSTQGFINHCRIAHRRDFKSHEEAAQASGQPVEIDEVGGIVGEEKTQSVPNGLVHPLIRSAPTDKEAYKALLSRIKASMEMYEQGKLPGVTSIPTSANPTPLKSKNSKPANAPSPDFVPSLTTPRLSELMRSRGFGGDLAQLVTEAKKKIDFDEDSDDESEDTDGVSSASQRPGTGVETPILPAMRVPSRAGVSPAPFGRPGSSKGVDARHGRLPGLSGISPRLTHATPVINTAAASHRNMGSTRLLSVEQHDHSDERHDDVDVDMLHNPSINDLSPNTVASNNAPSLVSDDGEYDEGDDAESASSEEEAEDSDVAEIDIEDDGVEKVVPRTILRNRSGSTGDSMRLRKEDKQVTFVSPVKDSRRTRRT